MVLKTTKTQKRRDALVEFIISLLEELGMDFVKIGSAFLDHPDQYPINLALSNRLK